MARPSSTTSSATPTWWSTSWAGTGSAYRWSSRPGRRARSPSPDDDGKVDGGSRDFCQHGAVARILVTEQLAPRGLAHLRDAGHEVDERFGLSDEELRRPVAGAQGLILRSASRGTAEARAARAARV